MKNEEMSSEQLRCLWQCYALLLELAGEDEALTEMAVRVEEGNIHTPMEQEGDGSAFQPEAVLPDAIDTDDPGPTLSGDEPEGSGDTV